MSGQGRAVRYIVSGRVQGVFYRASAVREARRFGLCGWARNLQDGRVEVVACGADEALASLAEWLWQGPPAAVVTGVEVEQYEDGDVSPGFDVR